MRHSVDISLYQKQRLIVKCTTTTTSQPFYGPFSGTTGVSQCQKKASPGLYGARRITRGRHTDNPGGRHSIQTNQQSTSSTLYVPWCKKALYKYSSFPFPYQSPHFYARCPSCCNPLNYPGLGTGRGICWIAYSCTMCLKKLNTMYYH